MSFPDQWFPKGGIMYLSGAQWLSGDKEGDFVSESARWSPNPLPFPPRHKLDCISQPPLPLAGATWLHLDQWNPNSQDAVMLSFQVCSSLPTPHPSSGQSSKSPLLCLLVEWGRPQGPGGGNIRKMKGSGILQRMQGAEPHWQPTLASDVSKK